MSSQTVVPVVFKSVLMLPFIVGVSTTSAFAETQAVAGAPPVVAAAAATVVPAPLGIGALGRIEPRSRVIRVTHDQGPQGARIEQLLVTEGQDVKAGEPIAVFSDQARRQAELDIQAAAIAVLQARRGASNAELVDAQADYARKKPLLETSAISRSTYDQATARVRKAEAEIATNTADIAAAKAQMKFAQERLKQSSVLAPISGTVLKVDARPGELVGDKGIVSMANLSEMDIVAEVYENDIARVALGQEAQIILSGQKGQYTAQVREIGYLVEKNDLNNTDPLADRDNRVIDVRLTLDPAGVEALKHQVYRQVQVQIKAP